MPAGAVRVRGLKELSRDFRRISKDLSRQLTDELKEAADPVKADAEDLALSQIRNMPRSPDWATMRIGVSKAQGLVYMVPATRSRGGKRGRSNLAGLLMDRAMDPALEKNQGVVFERIDDFIGGLADRYGF